MGRLSRRAFKELMKNYDVYAVMLIALVVSILGIIGTASIPLVLSGTLATLAIIAFSILKNREKDESIENVLEQIANTQRNGSASRFFTDWDDAGFRKRFETARQLSMLAIANHDFISLNEDRIREFTRDGGAVRYILVDPDGSAMKGFAARSDGAERDLARICLRIMSNLANESSQDSVEIRLIDQLPSAIITMLDHETTGGIIFAALCGFNQPYLARPSFVLHKNTDGRFFEFYETYFENLWNWEGCTPYRPAAMSGPTTVNPQPTNKLFPA